MARRKNQPETVQVKFHLAERLRSIRLELFGERGGSEMARRLGLPVRTWYNYEGGVTVPAEVLLRFVELTSVEPSWLLHGEGAKYRKAVVEPASPDDSVRTLLRSALKKLEDSALSRREGFPADSKGSDPSIEADENQVILLDVERPGHEPLTNSAGPRYIAARREWLAARRDLRCVRVEGDSMSPIVADGAYVAYSDSGDDPASLDGKLVVAWVDDRPLVRWLRISGRFSLLHAENPGAESGTLLLENGSSKIRKVLGISTPH